MVASNATVADSLRRYAAVLSLEKADRFRLKAYKNAAETIERLDKSVAQLVEQGSDLTELPGIGKGISQAIIELVQTGKLSRFEKISSALRPEQLELATRPRLDPKKVARIYKKLGINSLAELEANLHSGKIHAMAARRSKKWQLPPANLAMSTLPSLIIPSRSRSRTD